ncbi:MAG: hypothetical protein ACI8Y7_000328 [Candidatus Woesearchaeota archaeon]|jgi:hypothetical protein
MRFYSEKIEDILGISELPFVHYPNGFDAYSSLQTTSTGLILASFGIGPGDSGVFANLPAHANDSNSMYSRIETMLETIRRIKQAGSANAKTPLFVIGLEYPFQYSPPFFNLRGSFQSAGARDYLCEVNQLEQHRDFIRTGKD